MANEQAAIISSEMNLGPRQASAIVKLLREGATIPFIARYRKEATGSLDEPALLIISRRLEALDELDRRKAEVTEAIEARGAMTDSLRDRIAGCTDPAVLDDIFIPYRTRRASRASAARDRGLAPLADIIMRQETDDPAAEAAPFVNGSADGVPDADAAIAGAADIIAERISESEKARGLVRQRYLRGAVITATPIAQPADDAAESEEDAAPTEPAFWHDAIGLSEPLRLCPFGRLLAALSGETEGTLKIDLSLPAPDELPARLARMFVRPEGTEATATIITKAVRDAYRRLLRPAIATELLAAARERSEEAAIAEAADALRAQLMAAPAPRKRVMGLVPLPDEEGWAAACVDPAGRVMANDILHPATDYYGSADLLSYLIATFHIDIIAIAAGPGSREVSSFIESIALPAPVEITTVSAAEAAIYASSPLAAEELPGMSFPEAAAVSLARRVVDPLAELIKISPRDIAPGRWHSVVSPTRLRRELDSVVDSCVAAVGVDVNTASAPLLARVAGIGPKLAGHIVATRETSGPFATRDDLHKVPRMGEKAFTLSSPFLRITSGPEPLDSTPIHPDLYQLFSRMADDMGVDRERLVCDSNLYTRIPLAEYATRRVGMPTLRAAIEALQTRGVDPRLPVTAPSRVDGRQGPIFRSPSASAGIASQGSGAASHQAGSLDPSSLHIGQMVTGRVINLTPFGAFVDIGLPYNGLIHISQLSDDFVANPADIVSPGQQLTMRVIDIDLARCRVALSLRGVR